MLIKDSDSVGGWKTDSTLYEGRWTIMHAGVMICTYNDITHCDIIIDVHSNIIVMS